MRDLAPSVHLPVMDNSGFLFPILNVIVFFATLNAIYALTRKRWLYALVMAEGAAVALAWRLNVITDSGAATSAPTAVLVIVGAIDLSVLVAILVVSVRHARRDAADEDAKPEQVQGS